MANSIFKDLPKVKYFQTLLGPQKEKAQQATGIILSLIAFSFFGLFAISPTLGTIAKLKKELSDAQFVDAALGQKIQNLSILQKKYSALQNDIPVVLDALPANPQVPLLLAQIQAIAQNDHIQLDTLQNFQVELFKPLASDQKYYSYIFSLSGSGFLDDIQKFTISLTHMERIVSIDVFSMNKTAQDQLLRFTLQGIAYFKQ